MAELDDDVFGFFVRSVSRMEVLISFENLHSTPFDSLISQRSRKHRRPILPSYRAWFPLIMLLVSFFMTKIEEKGPQARANCPNNRDYAECVVNAIKGDHGEGIGKQHLLPVKDDFVRLGGCVEVPVDLGSGLHLLTSQTLSCSLQLYSSHFPNLVEDD